MFIQHVKSLKIFFMIFKNQYQLEKQGILLLRNTIIMIKGLYQVFRINLAFIYLPKDMISNLYV